MRKPQSSGIADRNKEYNGMMRIQYAFVFGFECVTMLNGAFNERPAPLSYPTDAPLYVTLLPLRAMLLPYTVRLLGGRVTANRELAECFGIGADRYIATFAERHNYVYSPVVMPPATGLPEKLLRLIKAGDLPAARALMTPDLSASVSDEAITEFFAPYSGITENPYRDLPATHYLSPVSGGNATGFIFKTSGGLISDIDET